MSVTLAQFGPVPASLIGNAQCTLRIVNEIFAAFPGRFHFNSGYRTAAHNAAVGGVSNSFHVTAEAADFGPFQTGQLESIRSIAAIYGYEVIPEPDKNHFHIEPAPGGKNCAGGNGSVTLGSGSMPAGGISKGTTPLLLGGLILILLLTD